MTAAVIGCGLVLPPGAEAGKNCVCKAHGQDYHEGDIACIRGHLARCEMYLNNTTWKQIADDCPEASLTIRPDLLARLQKLLDRPAPKTC